MNNLELGDDDPHTAADRIFGPCGDPACPTGVRSPSVPLPITLEGPPSRH